jgi:two-component system sensor histidine kinase KdpD
MRAAFLRSRVAGYVLSILGVVAVTAICVSLRSVYETTVALAFLLMVLFAAMAWGSVSALSASVVVVLCFNFYFLRPIGSFAIADPENWIALGAFLTTALTVGQLSARVRRRAGDARRLARVQAVLADLGERALRRERYGEVIDDAVALVARNLHADFCKVFELMPDRKALLLRSGAGRQPTLAPKLHRHLP